MIIYLSVRGDFDSEYDQRLYERRLKGLLQFGILILFEEQCRRYLP